MGELSKLPNIGVVIVILILLLVLMAIYHHVMIAIEAKKLNNIGTLVKVNDKNMNVYIEGNKQTNTVVLLSGSGVQAPIYDYKVLYSKLSDICRVAVVEKFGYGYSDIAKAKRDVKTMVEENRIALRKVGINGPYILMPHSMSALEAIYWAMTYPEEVKGIIGLDMAVPLTYDENDNNLLSLKFNKIMTFFGFHRISKFCPVSERELTDKEIKQNKYLVYRNSLNKNVFEECKLVYSNAKVVEKIGIPSIPILMFASKLTGSETSKRWRIAQEKFASESNKCELIILECGHNLHYYESDYMTVKIREFIVTFN
ncbi:alpha/beta hydrolase [Clostridium paridis]|uniref:Alpha/beta hydrolase n=1 Tax=Clostridium paridis TaxID=2803863 RepID=A0A937FHK9_9CLOT|nr:alpha/beta hydrolase [Clostridium paridis]MBL4933160.1 alpha/beta hydrolase [Clostridium paridis]